MRWRIAIFGTLGALATTVGAVFVLAPDLLLGIGPIRNAVVTFSTGPKAVMTAAAVVVGLYVLAAARSPSSDWGLVRKSAAEKRFEGTATNPPEAVTADRRSMTGAGVDADVEVAVANGGTPLRGLRDLLRDLATNAYAADPFETETARRAVRTGAWTDNPTAAAFLADEGGPTPPLLSRVRLWLAPERERRRRIEATMSEIERLREDR